MGRNAKTSPRKNVAMSLRRNVPMSRKDNVRLSRGKNARTFQELSALNLHPDNVAPSPDGNVETFLTRGSSPGLQPKNSPCLQSGSKHPLQGDQRAAMLCCHQPEVQPSLQTGLQ